MISIKLLNVLPDKPATSRYKMAGTPKGDDVATLEGVAFFAKNPDAIKKAVS